jgi:CxxC motif-containing protein (DUF1111 family)
MQITHVISVRFIAVCILCVFSSCTSKDEFPESAQNEYYAGGNQTVFISGAGAFSSTFPVLNASQSRVHEIGDMGFEATFISGSQIDIGGLGPVYNNVSCGSCHIADGRGKAPETGESLSSLLIRISIPGTNEHGGPLGVPGYGGQFQTRSIFGVAKEGDVNYSYEYLPGSFADGETFELRQPNIELSNTYSSIPSDVMLSPRLASPVFGLGLLEAIPESSILAREDALDANNDGISGKANRVWEVQKNRFSLGRFGWKAGQPSIIQQSAGAYVEDMGITNTIFTLESVYGQPQQSAANTHVELSDSTLHAVSFYVQTIAVPARRDVEKPQVKLGKTLFTQIGCANCHTPQQRTGVDVVFRAVSNQVIFPYTDLLLHDMGEELADNRPEFDADGKEWRTSPLWGIGLTGVVNGHTNFLHDGRARNFTEAILWHGGEGNNSRQAFKNLSSTNRQALLAFLKSL